MTWMWDRRRGSLAAVLACASAASVLALTVFAAPTLPNAETRAPSTVAAPRVPAAPTTLAPIFPVDAAPPLLPSEERATEHARPPAPQVRAASPLRTLSVRLSALEGQDKLGGAHSDGVHTPLPPAMGNPVTQAGRSAALTVSLRDLFAEGDASVIVVDPNTEERLYSYGGEEVYTAASVYKVFVAYSILQKVDAGELQMGSSFAGTTVDGCLTDMISYSDNECAAEWLFQEGYPQMTELAAALGASSTSFDIGDIETSPADVALFLTLLYRGELLSEASTDHLLTLMEEQIFRDGIPVGVAPDSAVADKIGFLGTLSHDSAIVYSPRGDYILVIFTDGLDDTAIAEAAETVDGWVHQE